MPLKKGSAKPAAKQERAKKMASGGDVIKSPKGVQGPAMIVKKRDGNRPVKIY